MYPIILFPDKKYHDMEQCFLCTDKKGFIDLAYFTDYNK